MGKNFLKFKKKTRLASAVVSVILGLSIGAAVLACLIFSFKLAGRPPEPLFYIISGSVAVVAAAMFIIILIPSDKRLARRLDREHSLNEKVSTMVEFRESSDPFAVLQREDADEKLGRVKFSPWRKKQVISMLLVFVLSAAALTSAFIVPTKGEYIEPERPLTEFDKKFILAELSDIISYVDKSLMADTLKDPILAELNALYEFVGAHEYLSEMKLEAIRSVIAVNREARRENTALLIGARLAECQNELLSDLGVELSALNGTGVQKAIGELMNGIGSRPRDEASLVADELIAAINSSGADETSNFTVMMKNLASAIRGYSNNSISSAEEAFGTVKTDAYNEIMLQSFNKAVVQSVISRLCTLFGITENDLFEADADEDIEITPPSVLQPGDVGPDDEDDPNKDISSGGIGSGDRVYGSNDMIYNPYTNDYVPYGQVLDEYNNKVIQMLNDGVIPPDFTEFMSEYFRNLSDYKPEGNK